MDLVDVPTVFLSVHQSVEARVKAGIGCHSQWVRQTAATILGALIFEGSEYDSQHEDRISVDDMVEALDYVAAQLRRRG